MAICQIKILWHFAKKYVNAGPYGAKISKRYPSYCFHPISPKLYEDIGYRGKYRLLPFLTISQVLEILWHFEILTLASMEIGKCAISSKRLTVRQ